MPNQRPILVVDDNEHNLELLEAYLDGCGRPVSLARDGHEAIEAVARERPALVLLDIMMPRMSGFQVCEKLKRDPATRDIPILVITALNEVGDIERARDAGADGFLIKPVGKQDLLDRVAAVLSGQKS